MKKLVYYGTIVLFLIFNMYGLAVGLFFAGRQAGMGIILPVLACVAVMACFLLCRIVGRIPWKKSPAILCNVVLGIMIGAAVSAKILLFTDVETQIVPLVLYVLWLLLLYGTGVLTCGYGGGILAVFFAAALTVRNSLDAGITGMLLAVMNLINIYILCVLLRSCKKPLKLWQERMLCIISGLLYGVSSVLFPLSGGLLAAAGIALVLKKKKTLKLSFLFMVAAYAMTIFLYFMIQKQQNNIFLLFFDGIGEALSEYHTMESFFMALFDNWEAVWQVRPDILFVSLLAGLTGFFLWKGLYRNAVTVVIYSNICIMMQMFAGSLVQIFWFWQGLVSLLASAFVLSAMKKKKKIPVKEMPEPEPMPEFIPEPEPEILTEELKEEPQLCEEEEEQEEPQPCEEEEEQEELQPCEEEKEQEEEKTQKPQITEDTLQIEIVDIGPSEEEIKKDTKDTHLQEMENEVQDIKQQMQVISKKVDMLIKVYRHEKKKKERH